MRKIGGCLGRLTLVMVGGLLPMLMVELGVRMADLAPPPQPNPTIWQPHPLFGWWHIPYSGGRFYSDYNEFTATVQINARSLRDREIGYDNPHGALRVLSLADSFGEALQVDLAETYHKQLESRLQLSFSRPVEVINAGVGGWGTDQAAIFYVAEGFRYQPDVVLLAFFVRNDPVNNYRPLELARNGGAQQKQFFSLSETGELIPPPLEENQAVDHSLAPPTELPPQLTAETQTDPTTAGRASPLLGVADFLWRYTASYRFVVPHLRSMPPVVQRLGPSGILGGEGVVRANHPPTPVPFFVYQNPPDAEFAAAWELTEAIIRRLQAEVTARGATLVVALIGAPEQLDPAAWAAIVARNPTMQGRSWDLTYPNRRLARFLTAEQIPHVDLLPHFQTAAAQPNSPPLHFQHDQHWTAAGHRVAATALYPLLLSELFSTFETEAE